MSSLLSMSVFVQFLSIRNHCIQANQVVAGCSKFNPLVFCMPNLLAYICINNSNY